MEQSVPEQNGSSPIVQSFPLGATAPWKDRFGRWFLTRMADVNTVLADNGTLADHTLQRQIERLSTALGTQFAFLPLLFGMPQMSNGAEHTKRRGMNADAVRAMPEKMPKHEIPEHLQRLLDAGTEIDGSNDLIKPLLDCWRTNLFGIAPTDSRAICDAIEALLNRASQGVLLGGPRALEQDAATLSKAYLRAVQSEGRAITETDYVTINLGFVGIEALQGFCTNVLELLAHNTELQEVLRSDPSKIAPFLIEAERMCAPLRYLQREIGPSGLKLDNVEFAAGTRVVIDLSSANRDPSIWVNPDVVDLNRPRQANVSFATGAHRCLGIQATRMFVPALLKNLLSICELHPGIKPAKRASNWVLDHATELPLLLKPLNPL